MSGSFQIASQASWVMVGEAGRVKDLSRYFILWHPSSGVLVGGLTAAYALIPIGGLGLSAAVTNLDRPSW